MQLELQKLRKELNGILASDKALKHALREVNKMDIIKASLIARNPKHQEVRVGEILDGQLQKDVPVGDYLFVQNCCEVVKMAYNNIEMGNGVDGNLLRNTYRILREDQDSRYRDDNPVVYNFNHVPPHCADIDERVNRSCRKIYDEKFQDDVIAKAMYIHNAIIDIWPFAEFNGEIAVLAMNYFLLEQGLMPIDMPMGRQDYFDLVAAGLQGRRLDEEYAFFKDAVFLKMHSAIDVCQDVANRG